MSNKTFDILKYVAMIGLPSLATLATSLNNGSKLVNKTKNHLRVGFCFSGY